MQVCAQLVDLRLENRCAMATSEEKNVSRRRKNRILPLHCGSPNASPEVVHRPTSQSPLQFDVRNIWQIRSEKYFASAPRLLSAALLERWPHVCRDKIAFTKLPSNQRDNVFYWKPKGKINNDLQPTNHFVSTTKISMRYVVTGFH